MNIGFGSACNQAARIATSETLGFVNPDAVLDPSWSNEVLTILSANPSCAAVEGKILLAQDPTRLNCKGSYVNLLGFGCTAGYGERDMPELEESLVSYPSGAAFAIRRSVFVTLGGFDESYFLYHEDVDLGMRVYSAGHTVVFAPRAVAWHRHKAILSPEKVRWLERNRWSTIAKNMPKDYFVKCLPLIVVFEVYLGIHLAMHGLIRSKAQAVIEFLTNARFIARARMASRGKGVPHGVTVYPMTDRFPTDGAASYDALLLGERLQSGYRKAFFGSCTRVNTPAHEDVARSSTE